MADQDLSLFSGNSIKSSPTPTPTLLLVESLERTSERYRNLASRAGFRLKTTSPGQVTNVVRGQFRPDLIVLPPSTGSPSASEMARRLKEDSASRDIPVMMVVHAVPSDPTLSRVYPTEACEYDESTDEQLIRTMRALRCHRATERAGNGNPGPEPLSPLEGDLAEDTFPGVMEFLFTVRKTGRILVLNGSKWSGRIYIEEGNVVHAEFAERRGVDAFHKMCFLTHGRFKFEPEFRTAERTMSENGMEILLESARRHDELQAAKEPWSSPAARRHAEMAP